jgi:dephospho-CoA kinase
MKKIGLTGGIGSGKSIIAKVFSQLFDIPIYNADNRAKYLMQNNFQLKNELITLLGVQTYLENNTLNRKFIADKIFNNSELLEKVNNLVHHQVGLDYNLWLKAQNSPYILHEAAILIESGFHKKMDHLITISAPQEIRIQRVQKRDKLSSEQILQRMKKQITDAEREQASQFVIINDGNASIIDQVRSIHKKLLNHG